MSHSISAITDNVKRDVQANFDRERLLFIDRVKADVQEIGAARRDVTALQSKLQRINEIDLKELDQAKIEALSKALKNKDVSQLASLLSDLKVTSEALIRVRSNQDITKICILEFVGARKDAITVPATASRGVCPALREALYPLKESANHSHDKIVLGYACAKGDVVRRIDDRAPQDNDCKW